MPALSSLLQAVVQRTSGSTSLETVSGRTAFASAVSNDLSEIIGQLNQVYFVLADALPSLPSLEVLDYGLSGNAILTHKNAAASSGSIYWDSLNARPKSVKETVDAIVSEIYRLENLMSRSYDVTPYDDSTVVADIGTNTDNITQLKLDTLGANYTLDADGAANLTYPLAQAIDAIGAMFTGYASTGISHVGSFPALSLSIAQADVTDLSTHLSNIRTFVGMDDASDTTPDYSVHGTVTYVSDGDTLEEAVQILDAALSLVDPANIVDVFHYIPAGVAATNVYTSWSTLYTDARAAADLREVVIVIEDPNDTGTITIPAGTYNFDNIQLIGHLNVPNPAAYFTGRVRIAFANGTTISNLTFIKNLEIYHSTGASTPITISGANEYALTLDNSALYIDSATSAFISLTGTSTCWITMRDGSFIAGDTSYSIVDLTTSSNSVELEVFDSCIVYNHSISGVASSFVEFHPYGSATVSATHTNMAGTITVNPVIVHQDIQVDGTLYAAQDIVHIGDTDTYIRFTTDSVDLRSAGRIGLQSDTAGVTINPTGWPSIDFMVDGDTVANVLHVDASGDEIFTNGKLTVQNDSDIECTTGSIDSTAVFRSLGRVQYGQISPNGGTSPVGSGLLDTTFSTDGTAAATFGYDDGVGLEWFTAATTGSEAGFRGSVEGITLRSGVVAAFKFRTPKSVTATRFVVGLTENTTLATIAGSDSLSAIEMIGLQFSDSRDTYFQLVNSNGSTFVTNSMSANVAPSNDTCYILKLEGDDTSVHMVLEDATGAVLTDCTAVVQLPAAATPMSPVIVVETQANASKYITLHSITIMQRGQVAVGK